MLHASYSVLMIFMRLVRHGFCVFVVVIVFMSLVGQLTLPFLPTDNSEDEDDDEGEEVLAPTPKQRKLASQIALRTSLHSGLYPSW